MSPALFIGLFILLTAAAGGALGWLALHLRLRIDGQQNEQQQLTEKINALLPQLQCGDCGYPGCRPYAAAIAAGSADISLCPPGGNATAQQLAELLNIAAPVLPPPQAVQVAQINEQDCVGCALCLPACPTDAIIGTARHAHVVITEHCVGCSLCLPPCPVDCIRMVPADEVARAG